MPEPGQAHGQRTSRDVLSDTATARSGQGSGGDALAVGIDSTSDIGLESNDDSDSTDHDSFSVDFGDNA